MLTNLKYYLIGITLIFGPVGLRVLTWSRPPVHQESMEDIQAGNELFTHNWTVNDPLCKGGDGLGPVYNATSCVACHKQGGIGGGGDNRHNVTTYVLELPDGNVKGGVVHAFASRLRYRETLSQFDGNLPHTSQPSLATVRARSRQLIGDKVLNLSQRNTPALFGCKDIDEIADSVIIAEERWQQLRWGGRGANSFQRPVGRAARLPDGRIGKFGWKAQSASLGEFVQAACANELGLGNPNEAQPKPLAYANYRTPGPDLTQQQCDQITAFCASLPQPIEVTYTDTKRQARVAAGEKLFHSIGCAHCHTPNLGSVQGLYSDLLLHRMGSDLTGSGAYYGSDPTPSTTPIIPTESSPGNAPRPDEWRTPPLWGVADSAPYLHDGRAATLSQAITAHGGQGADAAQKYSQLDVAQQQELLSFLKSLRAPTAQQVVQK